MSADSPSDASPMRTRQWMYIGPIIAAPIAHVAVSSYRLAKTRRARLAIVGVGIVGATAASVGMRLALMAHAGYPGGGETHADRVEVATKSGQEAIASPSFFTVLREALKGFG